MERDKLWEWRCMLRRLCANLFDVARVVCILHSVSMSSLTKTLPASDIYCFPLSLPVCSLYRTHKLNKIKYIHIYTHEANTHMPG